MENRSIRVVMLCGIGQSSRIMYHGLAPHVDICRVILEKKPSGILLVKRRLKKLGIIKTTGQVLFIFLNKILAQTSRTRNQQLISKFGLIDQEIPDDVLMNVDNINGEETIRLLEKINPHAVVVNGTRIISERVLSTVNAPFINTHMGITPKYRGVHGGYWALANGDPENCGVTVHLVDPGIDTGGVLYQDIIQTAEQDSFNTYPVHQIARAIPMMLKALQDVKNNRVKIKPGVPPSQLWYHPTLFEYICNWIKKGVR
jgi:folate-dependent phosphoribosylglycinamide formyltransferase PurN